MSLIYPVPDKLDKAMNKYELVVVAAKRARQLAVGAQPYVQSDSTNPLTIALEEIGKQVVKPIQTKPIEAIEDVRLRTAVPGAAATLGVVVLPRTEAIEDEEGEPDEILSGEDDEKVVDAHDELIQTALGANGEAEQEGEFGEEAGYEGTEGVTDIGGDPDAY